MTGIDWNPVILALIALISAIFATLAPVFVKAFFDAQTARLTKLKAVMENNDLIAQNAVLLIQQTFGALANSVKLQLAFKRANEALLKVGVDLPTDALRDLLNTAVGAMKLAWGKDWAAMKEPSAPTVPAVTPDVPVPPVVDETPVV